MSEILDFNGLKNRLEEKKKNGTEDDEVIVLTFDEASKLVDEFINIRKSLDKIQEVTGLYYAEELLSD